MSDDQVPQDAPAGVNAGAWARFLAHLKGDVTELEGDTTTSAAPVPTTSSPPETTPASPEPAAVPAPGADAPAPPVDTAPEAAVSVPSIGAMVCYRSAYGVQYGQVLAHDNADGQPAVRVAWVEGGESGPIPASDVETTDGAPSS